MNARALVLASLLSTGACLPGAVTHYAAVLTPVALCDVSRGERDCQPPPAGGSARESGSLSVDERGDATRVFFRGETFVGTMDGNGHLVVDVTRDAVRETSGCLTRTRTVIDVLHDDPGFGLRQELKGFYEEGSTAEGDPQQCGRNVPYGQVTRWRLDAVETSQP